MTSALAQIDWQQPWLQPLRSIGQAIASAPVWREAANQQAQASGLCNAQGKPLRFVPQQMLPADTGYEAHIHASAEVPTRDNLHDFFNALIWLHFPETKRMLNALHARTLPADRSASSGRRGRERDAATLFDENAALFVTCDESQGQALRRHDWAALLEQPGEMFFSRCDVMLFGHALMEKLVSPYKAITAHAWVVMVDSDWFALPEMQRLQDLDRRVAAQLSPGFVPADFAHLPILGVPGWWPEQTASFYADKAVFRPLRSSPAAPA